MTSVPVVAAVGSVDRERIAGTGGGVHRWHDLGIAASGDGRTFRAVFGRSDETFRRLDPASRMLVLACEALGLDRLLTPAQREATALVVATTVGCLDADRQFARSLGGEMLDAPIFPYTLPSTCVGEVALRHGLRGISICLSTAPGTGDEAFAEAVRLLATGEAEAVVAATVDVLRDDPPTCDAVVVLLTHPRLGLPSVAPWPPHAAQTFAALRRHLPPGDSQH
jgi:3-oxoacyl-(acyl-carrier-protein) synthase